MIDPIMVTNSQLKGESMDREELFDTLLPIIRPLAMNTLRIAIQGESPAEDEFLIHGTQAETSVFVRAEARGFFLEAQDELRKSYLHERFSLDHLRRQIAAHILTPIVERTPSPEELQNLLKRYLTSYLDILDATSNEVYAVISVLGNVDMEIEKLEFGHITLYKLDNVTQLLEECPSMREDGIRRLAHQKEEESKQPFGKNKCLAVVRNISVVDPIKASDYGLDLITTHTLALQVLCPRRQIGLDEEFTVSQQIVYAFASDGSKFSRSSFIGGGRGPFLLDEDWLDNHAYRIQLIDRFLQQIYPQVANDPDEKVKRAIEWCGRSLKETSNADAYIQATIALESLLLGNNEAKERNISERAAFLRSDDMPTRISTEDYFQRAYRSRNWIVHNGERDISFKTLRYYQEQVIEVLFAFLHHWLDLQSWSNFGSFKNWIQQQRYR